MAARPLASLAFALLLVGCAWSHDLVRDDAAHGLETAWQAHFAAVRARDVEAACAIYTDDASYEVDGVVAVRGRAALLELERASIAASTLGDVRHTTHALRVDGATAHEIGQVRGDVSAAGAAPREVVFDYVADWRRGSDGTWRIAHVHGRIAGSAEPPAATGEADCDLRPEFAAMKLPPRSQGPRPTCSIFTTVAVLEFAFAKATGTPMRLSVEYCNWATNAATGRADDGDFFHFALAGFERFGICRDELWPYAKQFAADATPSADALVDGGQRLAATKAALHVRWIRPNDGKPGLSAAQYDDVLATLRRGWPVAVGAAHSRVLVGYRADAAAPGGGVFFTLDSGHGAFAEVPAAFVREQVCDAFVVETAAR